MTAKTKLYIAGAVAVIGLTTLIHQYRVIRRLAAENAEMKKQQAELATLRATADRLPQTGLEPGQLEQWQKEHDELLRLRGEVSRLRDQVRAGTAKAAVEGQEAASPKSPVAPEPVRTYSAFGYAALGPGESYLLGGWEAHPGKRTLMFVMPSMSADIGENQILIETRIVEVPEGVMTASGLLGLKSGSSQNASGETLNRERMNAVWTMLQNTAGVDVMSTPRVSTLSGRQAQVAVQSPMAYVNQAGEIASLPIGTSIDMVPHLSANGTAVEMTVYATLTVPNSDYAPPQVPGTYRAPTAEKTK